MALTCLHMFRKVKEIKLPKEFEEIALDETDNKKLEPLNKALSKSKSSNKSTYASWARHFDIRMGMGSDIEFEAMLAYWLSWYFCQVA